MIMSKEEYTKKCFTTEEIKEDTHRKRTFNGLIAHEWTLLSRSVWSDGSSPRLLLYMKR